MATVMPENIKLRCKLLAESNTLTYLVTKLIISFKKYYLNFFFPFIISKATVLIMAHPVTAF
jgi:hypothetical protein